MRGDSSMKIIEPSPFYKRESNYLLIINYSAQAPSAFTQ